MVQCVIDLLTCLLVAARWRDGLFGRRAAMAALWLAALCPFTANYVAAPLTETLSLACIALAFYGLERWRTAGLGLNRWLWVIGCRAGLCGAAAAGAGTAGGCGGSGDAVDGLADAAGTLSSGGSVWPVALVAALCVVLPLAPWTVRNWRTFHVVQPLAPRYATDPGELVPLGFQRWYRSWGIDFASTEEVYWNYDGAAIEIGDLPSRAFDSEEQYERTDALLNDYNQTDNATPALDARFEKLGGGADRRTIRCATMLRCRWRGC